MDAYFPGSTTMDAINNVDKACIARVRAAISSYGSSQGTPLRVLLLFAHRSDMTIIIPFSP